MACQFNHGANDSEMMSMSDKAVNRFWREGLQSAAPRGVENNLCRQNSRQAKAAVRE